MPDHEPALEERLKAYPILRERFKSLLDLIEAPLGNMDKADDAEQRVIEEFRCLGNEVLHDWAKSKESKMTEDIVTKEGKLPNKGKKNCTGTQRSEK